MQHFALIPNDSVFGNIKLSLRLQKVSKKKRRELVALAVVGSLTACGNNEQVTKEEVFELSDDSEPVTATDTVTAE